MGYKKLYQKSQLVINGLIDKVDDLEYRLNNPIIATTQTECEYRTFLKTDNIIQCVNRFIWDGLPINLTSQQIEALLYQFGSLCMFEDERGYLCFAPYATTGRLNEYGLLDEITPITLDGRTHDTKRSVIFRGQPKPSIDEPIAVILNDYTSLTMIEPIKARGVINEATINPQVEAHIQLMCSISVSAKKALALCETEEQKKIITKQLKALLDPTQPIVAVSSQRNSKGGLDLPVEMFALGVNLAIQEYTNAIDYYDRTRRHFDGIPAPDTYAKKERLITSEAEDANTATNLSLDDGLRQRQQAIKLFTEYCKNPNNKNITCNINPILAPQKKEEIAEDNEEIDDSGEYEENV